MHSDEFTSSLSPLFILKYSKFDYHIDITYLIDENLFYIFIHSFLELKQEKSTFFEFFPYKCSKIYYHTKFYSIIILE